MTRRVVVGGGGTGGHLFPALVVARALRERDPRVEVAFVGSRREVERTIMESHGAVFIPMAIEGLKGRGLRAARGAVLAGVSVLRCLRLLGRLRPELVIGAGGYSAGPLVLAASLRRIPTLLLEQNVKPGLTNRLLRRRADRVVVAFEGARAAFGGKAVLLGNPVREEFYAIEPKPWTGRLSLLVFGGSQGSRFLNDRVASALPELRPARDRLDVVHQTGPVDRDRIEAAYRSAGFDRAVVAAFLHDMPARFAAADLVLARAGATTVAELAAARKPAILVPFAGASDNHQEANAREAERAGGAQVLTENEASPGALAARILAILERPEGLRAMAAGMGTLRRPGAARDIAALALEMMGDRDSRRGSSL